MHLTQPLHKALIERPRSERCCAVGAAPTGRLLSTASRGWPRCCANMACSPATGSACWGSTATTTSPSSMHLVGRRGDQPGQHPLEREGDRLLAGRLRHPVAAGRRAFPCRDAGLKALSRSLATLVHWGNGPAPEGALDGPALVAAATPADDLRRSGSDLAAVMYTGGTTVGPRRDAEPRQPLHQRAERQPGSAAAADSVGINCAPMFHVAAWRWRCS